MKDRNEIEKDIKTLMVSSRTPEEYTRSMVGVQLDVLLDIRDLLIDIKENTTLREGIAR